MFREALFKFVKFLDWLKALLVTLSSFTFCRFGYFKLSIEHKTQELRNTTELELNTLYGRQLHT